MMTNGSPGTTRSRSRCPCRSVKTAISAIRSLRSSIIFFRTARTSGGAWPSAHRPMARMPTICCLPSAAIASARFNSSLTAPSRHGSARSRPTGCPRGRLRPFSATSRAILWASRRTTTSASRWRGLKTRRRCSSGRMPGTCPGMRRRQPTSSSRRSASSQAASTSRTASRTSISAFG